MPDTFAHVRPSEDMGRTTTLLFVPASSATAPGPAWAVLCGACAAANWQWKDAAPWISLLLAILIAEALWSTWRNLLLYLNWTALLRHLAPTSDEPLAPGLPYTTPWSPLGRALGRWSRVRQILRSQLPAATRGAVFTLPVLPPIILLLSAVAGRSMVLLSLAALALSLVEWLVAQRHDTHFALQAGQRIGLSWLAGHAVLGQLTWVSLAMACCYAIVCQGALTLGQLAPQSEGAPASRGPSGARAWSLFLLYGGQVAAWMLLVLLKLPVRATAVGLLIAPQLLLLARLQTAGSPRWYLRHTVPFIMVSMPLAAWAV